MLAHKNYHHSLRIKKIYSTNNEANWLNVQAAAPSIHLCNLLSMKTVIIATHRSCVLVITIQPIWFSWCFYFTLVRCLDGKHTTKTVGFCSFFFSVCFIIDYANRYKSSLNVWILLWGSLLDSPMAVTDVSCWCRWNHNVFLFFAFLDWIHREYVCFQVAG